MISNTEKQDEIAIDVDIIMSGNVTWAGRSSMEVTTKLQQVSFSAFSLPQPDLTGDFGGQYQSLNNAF